ncbi:MAG: VWA domain-containing protein [Thermodesulfobacteriota bacterium]
MRILDLLGADLKELEVLRDKWAAAWETALAAWSRFTKLSDPRWCLTEEEEKEEQLTGSFAMIRLTDHAVVISLRQVQKLKLERFAVPILTHEIGHHVYAPADLRDNARLLVRIRAGLPSREHLAAFIANLYTDLLINDRLQRGAGLDVAGVYKALKAPSGDAVWNLYQRLYEVLWSLPPGTLVPGELSPRQQSDAVLGARVIRAYAKDWLEGAGRFAALFLPYLREMPERKERVYLSPWLDTKDAGVGEEVPDGLAEIEEGELEGAIHPAEDPDLSGLGDLDEPAQDGEGGEESTAPRAGGRAIKGGKKNNYRSPAQYTELMKSLGVKIKEKDLVIKYYRERAVPHLIRFPVRTVREAADPLPEGLDLWDPGSPLTELDWTETAVRSPVIIPGVTTVQRTYGLDAGGEPAKLPLDLYLGVDCSGSMTNPAYGLSYPVLAGTIIVLSALRAGARVMVTLSGEPGRYTSTDGFIRQEKEILKTLTGYLGTGYAFGILRLKEYILDRDKPKRPVHLLIVTDQDIFHMLREVGNGWEIARESLEKAGGGGTYVLNISWESHYKTQIEQMRRDGWNVFLVSSWEELVAFAREFARDKYEDKTGGGAR